MQKKIIAALIVASTICWSTAPAASSLALRSSRSNNVNSISAQQHDCCPRGKRPTIPVMLAVLPPSTMPCGDQHPCCMQQAPDHSPALPVVKTDSRPNSTNLSVVVANVNCRSSFLSPGETRHEATSESVLLRSTVLRI